MKETVRRERPHVTWTISKEALAYVREVRAAFPLKYRSESAVANECIMACRNAGGKKT